MAVRRRAAENRPQTKKRRNRWLGELERQFRYQVWANRETLAALRKWEQPTGKALRLFAHLLGTEWLWLSRLRRRASPLVVWPPLSLAECAEEVERLEAAWSEYFRGVSETSLSRAIAYVNSKGESWSNSELDILTHAALHSTYHRGQIALEMRGQGAEPPYTDFIHAVRKGLVS